VTVWRVYAWGDCPTCPAITDERCHDLRVRSTVRYRQNLSVHRDRPAYDVTDATSGV
jgi:hypothetical protein